MPELEIWMRVGQPLEPVLGDQDRILDAWQAGGVRGVVVGRLAFLADFPELPLAGDAAARAADEAPPVPSWRGTRSEVVWAYSPNHTVYRRWQVEPPADPPLRFPERREQLRQFLENVKRRGWPVYLLEPAAGAYASEAPDKGVPPPSGGMAALAGNERRQRAYLARLEDTLAQFPQADGAILDGPEWGYEIAPGHRSNVFDDLPPEVAPAAQDLGFEYARLVGAKDRLYQRLHKLSREAVMLAAPGGLSSGLSLIGHDPGIVSWFNFRARALTAFYQRVHQLVEALTRARGRQVKLGIAPRAPVFAALCGYDFPAIAPMFDLMLPKLYFWNRGVDGLYGTVARYVSTLGDWNPGLWEPEAFAALRALCGVALPSADPAAAPGQLMASLRELDYGFPNAFFTGVVAQEVRRAIAAADGYAWKVLPWVDTGRRPHGGDPIGAGDLKRILLAAKEGGARHVLYHNHAHLTAAEWSVISEYGGTAWRAGQGIHGSYVPPDGEAYKL